MENKRSFFSFFARGVTTTHPLCSVFTLLICSVFLFICITVPTAASAEAFPMPPVWLPINPYNAQGLEPNFQLLSDDQKEIAEEILGAYTSVFLGLGGYPILALDQSVTRRQWWREVGGQLLNTFFQTTVTNPRAMQDLVGSVTYKASTYDSYDDYEADTDPSLSDSSPKYFQFNPELTVAMKNYMAVYGSIYDWQFQTEPFTSNKVWQTSTVPVTSNYWTLLANLSEPHVRYNPSWSSNPSNWSNGYISGSYFQTYTNLFLNTSNGRYYFVDNSGNYYNSSNISFNEVYLSNGSGYSRSNSSRAAGSDQYPLYYPNADTYVDSVRQIYNTAYTVFTSTFMVFIEDFVKHVYVGASWAQREEIYNIDDLGIGLANTPYIDNVGSDAFVDINGLLGSLGADITDVRQGVLDNTIVRDGTQAQDLTEAMLTAIDKYVSQPSSGVVIPIGLFAPFTKYITYLWQQTQPLILYVRDLITALTFDGQGISWVFFGAVSTGLIGGVICKFLL